MRKLLCLYAGLLALVLLAVGCAANPPGLAAPHALSDSEKQNAIQIAIGRPDVKQRAADAAQYTAEAGWAAIVWQGKGIASWKGISNDWSTDPNRLLVPVSARYYVDIMVSFGQPQSWQSSTYYPPIYVDIDPDSGMVVLVQDNPFGNGVPLIPKPFPSPPTFTPVPLSPPLN